MDSEKPDVVLGPWDGCGCKECRAVGEVMGKIEPAMLEVIRELRDSDHGLVAGVVEQLYEIMSMLTTVHLSRVQQAADAMCSSGSCLMERARELQMKYIVHNEVENAVRKVLTSISSDAIREGGPGLKLVPPGFPEPGRLFCSGCDGDDDDDDTDGGGGGPKLH